MKSDVEARVSPTRVGAVFGALLVPSFVAVGAPSVALPAISRALGVPFGASSWVLASWALFTAVAMPFFGRLSARVGLRGCLVTGVALITAGSILAALAPSLVVLIIGRAIGGAGAGALVISSYASVAARLQGTDRGRALGIVAAVGTTASACGTLFGGLLTAWPGWRVVVGLPALAVLVLIPAARLAPTERRPGTRIDALGAILLTLVGGAVVVLLQAPSTGLPPVVILVLAVLGVVVMLALVAHVRHDPNGFVPKTIVAAPYFMVAGIIGLTVFAAYYGTLFAAPALIESATRWGTPLIGAVLLPCAAFSILGVKLVRTLIQRSSITVVAGWLGAVSTAGVLIAALLPTQPLFSVLGLALTTASFAAGQTVLFGLVPDLVEPDQQDSAQGLLDFLIYGGSSVGPAVVGGLSAGLPLANALAVAAILPLIAITVAFLARRSAPVTTA